MKQIFMFEFLLGTFNFLQGCKTQRFKNKAYLLFYINLIRLLTYKRNLTLLGLGGGAILPPSPLRGSQAKTI